MIHTGERLAMKAFDFKNDIPDNKPNHYLACPDNYCKIPANTISPIFNISAKTLQEKWQQIPLTEPRTKLISQDDHHLRYFYEQRSLIFKFPDYITVQIIAVDDTRSTIAMYSQAKYGYYDFNVNQHRIERWLKKLVSLNTLGA